MYYIWTQLLHYAPSSSSMSPFVHSATKLLHDVPQLLHDVPQLVPKPEQADSFERHR